MKRTAGFARPDAIMLLTAVAIILTTTLAGCKNSDSPPTPTETTASPTSTKTTPAWENKYNEDELHVYREAVQRLEAYEAKVQPIKAAGKATKAAKELYQDNLLTWRLDWDQLQSYEAQGIKIPRRPEVLSTELKSIKLPENGEAIVVLFRCIDSTKTGANQNGTPLATSVAYPTTQEIEIDRFADGRWRIASWKTTDLRCDA